MEAYSDTYYTTGITYQADNQPTRRPCSGAGVDISTLPMIGLSGTVDWGVHAYDPKGTNGVDPRNGGIVGTVSQDTTRNELDPRYAATEDWQAGISGVTSSSTPPSTAADRRWRRPQRPATLTARYQLDTDGSYMQGKLLNTYVTESWQRPTGCTARDVGRQPAATTRPRTTSTCWFRTRRPTASASRASCRESSSARTPPTRARRTPTSVPP